MSKKNKLHLENVQAVLLVVLQYQDTTQLSTFCGTYGQTSVLLKSLTNFLPLWVCLVTKGQPIIISQFHYLLSQQKNPRRELPLDSSKCSDESAVSLIMVDVLLSFRNDGGSFIPVSGDGQAEEEGMSSCLLIKDDNHLLIEWIAYHYLTQPLHYYVCHARITLGRKGCRETVQWLHDSTLQNYSICHLGRRRRYLLSPSPSMCYTTEKVLAVSLIDYQLDKSDFTTVSEENSYDSNTYCIESKC
jgi:hypothetical protein